MNRQTILDRLANASGANQRLTLANFEITGDTPNKRSKFAEMKTESPLVLREDNIRMVFTVHETVTADGTDGNSETFQLASNLIDTPNATPLVLYDAGQRVQPESIDFDADTFTYSDPSAGDELDVFYVAQDPVSVEIERRAPQAQGKVSDVVFDGVTEMLHQRNQNKNAVELNFAEPLERAIPKNWRVELYAEGPTALGFETGDGDEAVEAVNAVLSIPVTRGHERIDGLAQAVKLDIIDELE